MGEQLSREIKSRMGKLSLEPDPRAALEFTRVSDRVESLLTKIVPGTVDRCRISNPKHPLLFYIVPLPYEEHHYAAMKKFREFYGDMDEVQIQESQPAGGIIYPNYVAVCHKSRWHRGSILGTFLKETKAVPELWYTIFFLDTGQKEDCPFPKVRRLVRRYLFEWPALAVRATFAPNTMIRTWGNAVTREFFDYFARANPNCDVAFKRLTRVNGHQAWDIDVFIRLKADPEVEVNPDVEGHLDLKTGLEEILWDEAARTQLFEYY